MIERKMTPTLFLTLYLLLGDIVCLPTRPHLILLLRRVVPSSCQIIRHTASAYRDLLAILLRTVRHSAENLQCRVSEDQFEKTRLIPMRGERLRYNFIGAMRRDVGLG
jgi:hypothetical protein